MGGTTGFVAPQQQQQQTKRVAPMLNFATSMPSAASARSSHAEAFQPQQQQPAAAAAASAFSTAAATTTNGRCGRSQAAAAVVGATAATPTARARTATRTTTAAAAATATTNNKQKSNSSGSNSKQRLDFLQQQSGRVVSASAFRMDDRCRLAERANVRNVTVRARTLTLFVVRVYVVNSYYFNLATETSQAHRPMLTIECALQRVQQRANFKVLVSERNG
jgi:hypothetical protein